MMSDAEKRRARSMWRWIGDERPDWAEETGPGERSVWDFPRPPRVQPVGQTVRILLGGQEIVVTDDALEVCETASPPTVYVPASAVRADRVATGPHSFCEWKGEATHWRLTVAGKSFDRVAWSYPKVVASYSELSDHLAFYPGRVDACFLGEQRVTPQPGGFYGGWITPDLRGPWKGDPGTAGW